MILKDVYKRQGINGTTVVFPIVFMIGLNGTAANAEAIAAGASAVTSMNLQLFRYAMLGGAGGTLGPVSYTHLDVYKRQIKHYI